MLSFQDLNQLGHRNLARKDFNFFFMHNDFYGDIYSGYGMNSAISK